MAEVSVSSWPCPFCCAPLHAARDLAQPPQGAELIAISAGRSQRPSSIGSVRRISKSFSPTALGGYRPGGCQVSERPAKCGLARASATKKAAADERSACRHLIDPSRRRDQALALLSTARSERSA